MKRTTAATITTGLTLTVAGLVLGSVAMQGATAAPEVDAKRNDDTPDLVLVADDDDDDTNDNTNNTRDTRSKNTGVSKSTRDHTNSRFTKVSRDRDLSRSDKTRDWTRDGKKKTLKRDWTANSTNDASRNDTRR